MPKADSVVVDTLAKHDCTVEWLPNGYYVYEERWTPEGGLQIYGYVEGDAGPHAPWKR